jgi:hypothetical protein
VAPKPDNLRLDDLEKAVTSLANGMASLYLGTTRLALAFASHKLPLRGYLAAIAILCNEVKGKSALALARDLRISYKAAFVLLHKLREAMAEEMKGRTLGGEGKTAEIDSGYFGGYVKPANLHERRLDRRFAENAPRA